MSIFKGPLKEKKQTYLLIGDKVVAGSRLHFHVLSADMTSKTVVNCLPKLF